MQHECLLGLNGGSSHSFMSGECILCKQSVDKSIQKKGWFQARYINMSYHILHLFPLVDCGYYYSFSSRINFCSVF